MVNKTFLGGGRSFQSDERTLRGLSLTFRIIWLLLIATLIRGARRTFAVGLSESFSGGFAGRCVGPSTGSSLDDLFASVCSEVITSVVKFASERIDRDD